MTGRHGGPFAAVGAALAGILLAAPAAGQQTPVLSIGSPSVLEGGPGGLASLTFQVSLSAASTSPVRVRVRDAGDGTATSGTDYVAVRPWVVDFPEGVTMRSVTVEVHGDDTYEPDETVVLELYNPQEASVSATAGKGTGTITNDDPLPLSISSPSVAEGAAGATATLTYTVTLSQPAPGQLTLQYADAGTGTATSGTDYAAIAAGTLTFAEGDTVQSFSVTVKGDALDEPDETVMVTLSGTKVATTTGTGTITDDDDAPTLSISSPTVAEGAAGTKSTLTFKVALSAKSGKQVTVGYRDIRTGTATANHDYSSFSDATLTFEAGDTEKSFDVIVHGDATDEPDETLVVALNRATNARISKPSPDTGTGTITDDDDAPAVTLILSRTTIDESGTHTSATVTAELDAASGAATTVTVSAAPGTNAAAGDFELSSNKTLTIAAGATESTGTVTVAAVDNAVEGPDKTVTVSGTVSNSIGGYSHPADVTLTIADDDTTPKVTLVLSRSTIDESGAHNAATVTATMSPASVQSTTVTVSAAAGTNAAAGDFELSSNKTLTIAAGATESTGTVTVTAVDNALDEPDKTVTVSGTATNTRGATSPDAVTLTIADDDDAPTLSISSPTVAEGAAGTMSTLTFKVTLSAKSGKQVTVGYRDIRTGTATANHDYSSFSDATLTFAAGDREESFDVIVHGDATDEPDETLVVALNRATNGTISTDTGTGTITDDDDAPAVTLILSRTTIDESGTHTSATVTAELDAASGAATTVTVSAAPGTNAAAVDFELSSNKTLTIAAGATESTGTVTVAAVDNAVEGPDKTVTVSGTVSNSIGGYSNPADVTLTIADDDATPKVTLVLSRSTINESGTPNAATVTATMSPAPLQSTTVTVAAAAGTNAAAGDFELSSNKTLTIAAGATESTGTVTVTAVDNALDGPDKTVSVSGTAENTRGATSPDAVTLTIADDEATPKVTLVLSRSTINESGTLNAATVTATMSPASVQSTTVTVAAAPGTNAASDDYALSSNKTLTIAAGATESTGTVTVTAVDNVLDESNKKVTVSGTAANTQGATSPDAVELTISDDDDAPAVTLILSRTTIDESGTSTSATVTAELDAASGAATTVTVSAAAGTNAAAGDFELSSDKTLTIAAGATESTGTVTITAVDNAVDGPDKTVTVSGTVSNSIGGYSNPADLTLTIADDDATPKVTLVLSRSTIDESGTHNAATVTATMSPASVQSTTVTVAAAAGTNAAAGDYALSSNKTLTIAAGATESTGTVTVTAVDNAVDGPDKTVTVSGTAENTRAATSPDAVTLTIADDEATPKVTLVLSRSTIDESGTHNAATVTATMSPASVQSTTVTVSAAPGTNAAAGDYALSSNKTLTIAAGATESTGTVTVTAVDNALDGPDKIVTVSGTAANSRGATSPDAVELTIKDDDGAPTVTLVLSRTTINESGTHTSATVTAEMDAVAGAATTVTVSAAAGTNAAAGDFELSSDKTLTIAAGATESTGTVTITAVDNAVDGPDKTVTVSGTVSNSIGGYSNPADVTLTIADDDATPKVTLVLSRSTIDESGTHNAATMSPASVQSTTVTVSAAAGTNAAAGDYTLSSNKTLTIAAGATESTGTVTVTAVDNGLDGPDKTVTVSGTAENTRGATSPDAVTLTIADDEFTPAATLILSPQTISESGAGNASTVTAMLSHPSSALTTLTISATPGTNAAASDFALSANTALTIAVGATTSTGTVTITANDNDDDEADKQVIVSGAAANALGVSDPSDMMLTITDDDMSGGGSDMLISISSHGVTEGDLGTGDLAYTVRLRPASMVATSIDYADAGSGTATPGVDYVPLSPGMLVFAPGDTVKTVTVQVRGDELVESDETVLVALSNPVGASIAVGTATGTIVNDDAPELWLEPDAVIEGDHGSQYLIYTAKLHPVSPHSVTVSYSDAGTGTATPGIDYDFLEPGTLVFSPGEREKSFGVIVHGDTAPEDDETVVAVLSHPANADIVPGRDAATATIVDDDLPLLVIGSPTVEEGDGEPTALVFPVTLSVASGRQVKAKYADGGGGTATSGTDYEPVEPGELVFAPGETAKTVSVAVLGDELDEPDETVELALSEPRNAELATAAGLGTIVDDDAEPVVSVGSPSVEEGDFGAAPTLEYAVTLSAASALQVTVRYADGGGGTATSGTDYEAVEPGELVFAPGETAKTVSVVVLGDELDEPDETVELALGRLQNAGLAVAVGLGTILDDDAEPVVSVGSPSVEEGDFGAVPTLEYAVTLSAASTRQVTVRYADGGGGTAASGTDYEAVEPGELVFAPGETAKTVSVVVLGDELDEPDETVELALSEPEHAELAAAAGLGTIVDDDAEPIVSVSSPSAEEGDFGATSALEYAVTLSAASGRQVTVGYADGGGGTATSGTDYEPVEPGKLVFAPGETAKTVAVVVLGDKLDEPDETVELVLSEPKNAVLAAAAAAAGLGTILDDDVDLMPTFDASVPPQHYTEGDPVPPLVLPLAKGGDGPLVYGLAPAPPPGITFDPGSRTLSGTPSSGLESTPYEYTATDQDGDAATLSFTITVVPRQTRIDRIERASRAILPVVARTWTDMAATAVEARVDHAESGTGVRIGAWGNGEYRQLSGGESHPVDWSGEIGGGGVALDAKLGPNFVAGVAATHLEGWFDYTDVGGQENVEGTYESRVTGLHPYLGWRAPNGSRLYGTVAWGRNDVAIKDDEAGHQAGGGSLAALAVGGNVRLAGGSTGRTTLDVRGGAQGTRIGLESNGDLLEALSLGVYRARLSLIGSHTFAFGSGASLRPSAELGLRRDGGDGQTGSGMEVGGRIAWTALGSRLRMEARAHALLDGPDGMQEWGAGGFLELDPGANGTGLSMKLAPSWGPAFSGVGQTWEQNPVAASPHRPPSLPRQSRLEAEIGYGIPVGELGLLQPFGAVQPGGGGGASHLYRLGGRFRARPDLGLGVGVEALYRDGARDGQLPKYGLKLGIAFKR